MTAQDALSLTYLKVANKAIISLAGIEYFPNLKTLNCEGNQLKELDLSQLTQLVTLNCSKNKLTSLTVDSSTLIQLNCSYNAVRELSLTAPNLTVLNCEVNELSSLEFDAPNLTTLNCQNNKLNKLSLSGFPNLLTVRCSCNNLTELDIGALQKLTELHCATNQLTHLDLTQLTSLETLNCGYNRLVFLDLSNFPNLTSLNTGYQTQTSTIPIRYNPNSGDYSVDLSNADFIDLASIVMIRHDVIPTQYCTFDKSTGTVYSTKYAKGLHVTVRLPFSNDHLSYPTMDIKIPLQCIHEWNEADCSQPKNCKHCRLTEGTVQHKSLLPATADKPETCTFCGYEGLHPTDHVWNPATCAYPMRCKYCYLTEGTPLPHNMRPATNTLPEVCVDCGFRKGHPLEHVWIAATCTSPKRCKFCGLKEGTSLGHQYDSEVSCKDTVVHCIRCTNTQWNTLTHDWIQISCKKRRCSVCGTTENTNQEHVWTEATLLKAPHCLYCNATKKNPYRTQLFILILSAIYALELTASVWYLLDYKRERKY